MSKYVIYSILVSATMLLASCGRKPNYKASLKNDVDSVSYYLGYDMGVQLARMEFDNFNIDAMARGVLEALKSGVLEMDEFELWEEQQTRQMYFQMFFSKMQERNDEKTLQEGFDFLEANKSKPGIVTLPSGLQYRIIREGSGIKPGREDVVEVIYHGTLIDGKVFDSSKERGETVHFPVNGVVVGFSEALTLMNEGSVWEIFIPSELGYGSFGSPPDIKPNSVIIFELELVSVVINETEEE